MNIPQKLINCRVYNNGTDLIGIADVDLPKLEPMTDTVKGAGVAGEIDDPVLGHYKSMDMTIKFRDLSPESAVLASQTSKTLDFRAASQVYDSGTGAYRVRPVKVIARGVPKGYELGKADPGKPTDTTVHLEVNYIKIDIDGATKVEIDKYNFISKIDGTDYLADVRDALGL